MPVTYTEADEQEFQLDASLDKYNLDVEAEQQPVLYKKWSDKYSNAQAEADLAKEARDRKTAELDAYIRDPLNWGEAMPDTKMTEAGVGGWVKRNPEYREAVEKYIEATRVANIIKGCMWAMEHRKVMIEILTQQHGQQYFSKPHVSQQIRQEAEAETRTAITDQLTNEGTRSRRQRRML